ncbi:MAG: hypothetical protein U5L02_06425 [Rheinheimera sp.]|nr:hypothetical protein [Rheinheimera sp.]
MPKKNGVELPEDTNKKDAWKAVKEILADLGESVAEGNEPQNQDNQTPVVTEATTAPTLQTAKTKSKELTHYTISVSRPTDTKLQDFTVNANGVNFQIHFGKKVKVPAVVVSILNDAVERKPAHRDLETNDWIEESFEHRYSFAIHEEHFQ